MSSIALLQALEKYLKEETKNLRFQKPERPDQIPGNLKTNTPLGTFGVSGQGRTITKRPVWDRSVATLNRKQRQVEADPDDNYFTDHPPVFDDSDEGFTNHRPEGGNDDFFTDHPSPWDDTDPSFGVDPDKPRDLFFRDMNDGKRVPAVRPNVYIGYMPATTADYYQIAPYIRLSSDKAGYAWELTCFQFTYRVNIDMVLFNSHDNSAAYFDIANLVETVISALLKLPCHTLENRFVLQEAWEWTIHEPETQAGGWNSATLVTSWNCLAPALLSGEDINGYSAK